MRSRRLVLVLLAGVLAGPALVACTGDDSPTPGSSVSATGSAPTGSDGPGGPGGSGLEQAAEQVTRQYLSAPEPAVLGSVRGTVSGLDGGRAVEVPGAVDVLSVTAGPASTAVRWRMSSERPVGNVSTETYRTQYWGLPDVSKVVLEAKQADLRLKTSHYTSVSAYTGNCTCAFISGDLGPSGLEMSILYPALPPSVTEVELRVPGFPALAVPVTRR